MKWIEEKQALYRRNQELVEKVPSTSTGTIQITSIAYGMQKMVPRRIAFLYRSNKWKQRRLA